MANRCFSSSLLYALRNEISVQMLIEKTLSIPCRVTEGRFRFLCPLCSGYDTAVNPKTNLARCFRCEKNYNPIDLVMLDRQADFVQSVKFLQSIHQKDDEGHYYQDFKTISTSNHQDQGRMNPQTPSEASPCSIGEILDSVLPRINEGVAKNHSVASRSNSSMAVRPITLEDRIVKLEQQIKLLDRQMKKIARALNVGPASE
jgi:hypothetical protein